jgi:hypothetical protein
VASRPASTDQARAAALERLRGYRVRAERGRGVGPEIEAFVRSLKKVSAQASRASEAWETAAPDGVRAATGVVDLKGGTLIVRVRSAADRHRADRWVRGGGLTELRALARAPITRVRFVLDASAGTTARD